MNEAKQCQGRWQRRQRNIPPLPVPDLGQTSIVNFECVLKVRRKQKYRKLFNLLLLTAIPTLIVIVQCILNLKEDLEVFVFRVFVLSVR